MRSVKMAIGAAAIGVLLAASLAGPATAAGAVTVGKFVQELAKTKGLNATDPRVAADSLRLAGVKLPADLDLSRTLTQRDVADMASRAGLRVTTSDPDATFTEEQVDRFFRSFGTELGTSNAVAGSQTEGGFDPFTKGQKKGSSKAKYNRSPSEPE